MSRADALTKEYLSNNEIFADIFNYLIYDGQQRILPENLIERDTSEIALPIGKHGALATIQKFRDILKGCIAKEHKNTLYVLFGVENQSHIHYAMPVRNMLYDAINYSSQVNEKTKQYRKERKQNSDFKETTEEFLSGWHPEDHLIPVITVTIYFGNDEWDAARSLQEMFSETDESIKKFLPDYKLHLISCNNISDFTKFYTEFGRLMHILKVVSDENAMDTLFSNSDYSTFSITAAQIINTFTGLGLSIPEKEETINMRNAWTDHKESGRREGLAEGRIKGYNEATTGYTQRMHRAGIPLEVIAEVIEKPVTEVQKILSSESGH